MKSAASTYGKSYAIDVITHFLSLLDYFKAKSGHQIIASVKVSRYISEG